MEAFPYVRFRHKDSLKFWRKVIISPLLTRIFFYTRIFLKPRRVHLWMFPALRNETFSAKLFYPPSMHKIFPIPEVFWNTEVFAYEVFRYYDKSFRQSRENTQLRPIWKVFDTRQFLKNKRSLTMFFILVLWDEEFSSKPWYASSQLKKYFETKLFLKQKRVRLWSFFGTVSQKYFDAKWWDPHSYPWIFSKPENFWLSEGSSMKFSGALIQKRINTKWLFPPSWLESFSETRIFLKHGRVHLWRFPAVSHKNYSLKPWCPLPVRVSFRYQRILETQNCSPVKFFCTTTNFFDKTVRSLNHLQYKKFSIEDFFWKKAFVNEVFRYCGKIVSLKTWYPLTSYL